MAIQQVDLVGDTGRPVVTPSAISALSDAFRKGFIDTTDIIERVGERSRTKEALDIAQNKQALAEVTDPALIQAKRNQQLAAGAAAGSALTLNPLAEQAKTAELKAAIFDAQAKPGGFDLMQTALSKAGFPVSIDPNTGLTDANKTEITKRFAALQDYTVKRADAEERIKGTETKFLPTEQTLPDGSVTKGQLPALFKGAEQISSDQFKNWTQEAEALRRTPFSTWYSLQSAQPGQVVAPIAPPTTPTVVISPIEAAQQRAQLSNQGVPNAASLTDQQVAALIQPRVTPAAPVVTPTIGQTAPGLGIVTSTAPPPIPKPPTETQGRAGSFSSRMNSAENQLGALIGSGFDPTTVSVAAQQIGIFPEGFKADDIKRFENAKLQWVTALLRRESGAAVPKWELNIYDRAFFPQWGDSPDIIAQKAAVRQQSAQSLAQEAAGKSTVVAPITPDILPPPTTSTGAIENTATVGGKTYKVKIDSAGRKRYFLVQ